MLQPIHDPTRVSEFTKSTIDLIVTSHPELVRESGAIPVLISDHYLVYGVHCWKVPKKDGRSIKFRCFKDIYNDDFRDTYSMPHGSISLTAMMLMMHGQYGILCS